MKTYVKKFTAFILAITLTLPFMVFAAAQDEKATSDGPDIAYEMSEMRNAYEKHFLMSDGTAVAATYADPVNYYDISDNTWKEIDNTLTLKNGRYQNKGHGGFDVSFRGESNTGDLVKITVDEHTLSWNVSVQNALGTKDTLKKQVSATVSRNQDSQNNKFAAKNAGASIKYNSPFSGNKLIDVNYTVSQYKVKEDITIYSPKDGNAIYYTYNCGELTAVLNPDNSIDFIDESGNPIYTVHSPYMYDSAGNGSCSFRITLKQTDDICTVVMTPDKEWLNSSDRVYPVVIDPTVSNDKTTVNYDDTYVYQGDTAGANYLNQKMTIGLRYGVQNYALLKFATVPSVPDNATIDKVELIFIMPTGSTSGGPFSLHSLNSTWTEETVCFANRPATGILLAENINANFSTKKLIFDITSHYILNNAVVTNGFQISYTNTSVNDYNTVYTSNCGTSSSFPVLQIIYTVTNDIGVNDSIATADLIELSPNPNDITSTQGIITTEEAPVPDIDCFKFTAPRHGRIEITLSAIQCNHNITVKKSDGTEVTTAYTSSAAMGGPGVVKYTTVSFVATKTSPLTDYYIIIEGAQGETSFTNYTLSLRYSTRYAQMNWAYPISGSSSYINSPVKTRSDGYHKGMDIDADIGTSLYAPTYSYVWTYFYSADEEEHGSAGIYVSLRTYGADPFNNQNFLQITYMHMSAVRISTNQVLQAGSYIGHSGNTGNSTGPHLHFEVFSNDGSRNYITASSQHLDTIVNSYGFYYDSITFNGTPY